MTEIWIYSLVSVLVVSLLSLVGVVTLAINAQRLRSVLLYLVSFSAGALLGDVFLHLLPELTENTTGSTTGFYLLGGIIVFFILERLILWHHSHMEHEEQIHSAAYLVLFGDALHNFIDGLIIAASFLVSIPLGIATTLAVIAHEVPHEIGDFAVLLHGGWDRWRALKYNFFSALTAVAGVLVVLPFASTHGEPPRFFLALAAASFIYIAMADLIPELHKEVSVKKSVIQLICLLAGIAAMALLLLLE
jgi:zinc and cadmium transporter